MKKLNQTQKKLNVRRILVGIVFMPIILFQMSCYSYSAEGTNVTMVKAKEKAMTELGEIKTNEEEPMIEEEISKEESNEEESKAEEKVEESEEEFQKETQERVIDPDKKMVALTFDDGPSSKNTQNILDLLAEYGAVATFFEVGKNAERYPELVKAEFDAGCEIGNHTYSHINMKNCSYDTVLSEINRTNDIITNITGEAPTFVRPPYGEVNKSALSDAQMASLLWSVDTRDWESRNKDKIMNVIKEEETLDGAVILMHSTHEETVEALELLLPYLAENGYQCVTVSEMFEYKYNEEIEQGKTYGYVYFSNKKANR